MSEQNTKNGFKQALADNTTKANTAFLTELRSKLPQFFTADGSFDMEKFQADLQDNNVNEIRDGYTLNYVGKTYARLQTGQPTKTVIIPDQKHNKLPENADSKNVFLTGDNLDVLKHLQKAYTNSIDFIYIDPPYNTGSDGFAYNDTFTHSDEELQGILGFTEEEIKRLHILNGRSSHSAWLTFMYPRLKIAQQLLKDTGVIFVSIDDNEQANLKLLMDDVFGEGNFVGNVANINNPKGRSDDKFFATSYENLMVYSKNINNLIWKGFEAGEEIIKRYNKTDDFGKYREIDLRKTGDNDLREDRPNLFYYFHYNEKTGDFYPSYELEAPLSYISIFPQREDNKEGNWRWGIQTATDRTDELIPKFMPSRKVWGVMQKDYLSNRDLVKPTNSWTFKDVNSERGTEHFISLGFDKRVFPKPKPLGTIKRALQLGTQKNALCLDFFAGSGTTADAVMQLNAEDGGSRQFILTTLDELTYKGEKDKEGNYIIDPNTRLPKVKTSSIQLEVGYATIDEISRERIKRAGAKIKSENPDWNGDVGFKHFYVKDMEVETVDRIVNFDPNRLELFPENTNMVSEFQRTDLGTSGTDTILQTWLINDGYNFDMVANKIKFAENYGYQIDNRLYIIDAFTQEDIKVLLDKIGNNKLLASTIIVFGYSLDFTSLTCLKNNVKTNLDSVKVEMRY